VRRRLMLTAALLVSAAPLQAQSLLDRPPNLHGDWVGSSGRLYFHFLHRFSSSPAPVRKVSNVPTFTMALGLPKSLLAGMHYATNSQLAPGYPNEWEVFLRARPLAQSNGSPIDLGGQVGYNLASEGVDGEVSIARRQGAVRLIAATRLLADPYEAGRVRIALATGATIRVGSYFAIAGDVARLLDPAISDRLAWSAGVHIALPHTPHTLSLHAANTNAATLQGLSRGEERLRYGFEFTVPVTPQRWLSSKPKAVAAAPAAAPSSPASENPVAAPGVVKEVSIKDFAFGAPIQIAPGTTVVWKNEDPMAHTVTSTEGKFDSGVIEGGAVWRHTFTEAGTFPFACTPHPFMKGSVVVK
jgi:plastocyanin